MSRILIALTSVLATVLIASPASAAEEAPRASASFNGEVLQVAYAGDRVFAAGEFTHGLDTDGVYRRRDHLAAVSAATGRLLPFRADIDGTVHEVAATGDHLYIGGQFRRIDGHYLPKAARFDLATGEVDTGWRPRPSGAVFAIEPAGDTVYLGGRFGQVAGEPSPRLAAVSADSGAPVEAFTPSVEDGAIRDLASDGDRLYAVGAFRSVDGDSSLRHFAAVDRETGRADGSFRPGLTALAYQLTVHEGSLYLAVDGRGGSLVSYSTSGRLKWSVAADGGLQAVAVDGDTVVAGGHFDRVCRMKAPAVGECYAGKVRRGKLFAVDLSGGLRDWNPHADSAVGVHALAAAPGASGFAAGGAFLTFGDGAVPQRAFALFD
ncbi:PQQ-binding-like beta-propeller repeat protein [Salininema proteolyticum]|uniref:Outer membrane protein assembly factor BamB, contains PQQ-like beta-propeller repeat n=1 Tax=Salininema proteolyticum TaxID=1607685 RepID=A0ABV8TWB6_9ACTN